jgi:AcrR family transcriptional regulator
MTPLRREDVLAAALDLLDAEGLDALTMQKLATSLHVQAGALYWHFNSQRGLVDAMAEPLAAGVGGPGATGDGTWDEQLTQLGMRLRKALLAHRDGARVVTETVGAAGGANTLPVGRTSTELLIAAGFPPGQATWLTSELIHYVLGQTMEEQARAASAQSADPDEQVAYALSVFLDGIKRRLQ